MIRLQHCCHDCHDCHDNDDDNDDDDDDDNDDDDDDSVDDDDDGDDVIISSICLPHATVGRAADSCAMNAISRRL